MLSYWPAPPPSRGGPELVWVSSPSPAPDKTHSPQGLRGGSTKNAQCLNARLMFWVLFFNHMPPSPRRSLKLKCCSFKQISMSAQL